MHAILHFFRGLSSPGTRSKRYVVLIVCLLLIFSTTLIVWNCYQSDNLTLPPLTDEERELLGEWKFSLNQQALAFDYGYTLLPDHKCIKRWYVSHTNEINQENHDHVWWRNGHELTIRAQNGAGKTLFTIGPKSWTRSFPSDSIYTLTPDGPGRFKTVERVAIKEFFDEPQLTGSGEMVRVDIQR
ncbi:MAG: hypothetical protein U0798_05460 [Gemmataceae bacterium]